MADAILPCAGAARQSAEPFVRKRHVLDPHPRKRIYMVN